MTGSTLDDDGSYPWIPLVSLEQMEQTDYDVLIVGTGAGGGAVLWRLCEQWRANGKRIGVVEAGGLFLPSHAVNLPTIVNYQNIYFNPKYVQPVGIQPSEMPGARILYGIGGKTLLWGTVSPRMLASEIGQWPVPFKEMNLYYNIAEEIMNVNQDFPQSLSFTSIVLKRLRERGFYEADYIPYATNWKPSHDGVIKSDVYFSSITFLATALNIRPVDIAIKARAAKVLYAQGTIEGVEIKGPDKKSHYIRAKTVILSAGTFETPRILLNSGLSGNIGHYLTPHSHIPTLGMFNRAEFPELLGVLSALIPQSEERPFQLQIGGPLPYITFQYQVQPLQNELITYLSGFGVVESRFQNRVSLRPVDLDYAVIRQMWQTMQLAADAAGMRLVFPQNGQQGIIPLSPPGSDGHASGTCRMGDNPEQAATDRFGEVFGISGLYVADNSVLPTLPAANPTLTTVALAIRTADVISRRFR
jgi:choline dehydrogenase-like flavoprotein